LNLTQNKQLFTQPILLTHVHTNWLNARAPVITFPSYTTAARCITIALYIYYGTFAEINLKGSEYYNDLMKITDTHRHPYTKRKVVAKFRI
jgi:hypothetical protein